MLSSTFQLGDFEVNPVENTVTKEGALTRLAPKTMEILLHLVKHSDRVVSAKELLENFWPNRIVDESTIHRQISLIRQALDDSSRNSRYIKTYSKRGYRSVAEAAIRQPSEDAETAGQSEQRRRRRLQLGYPRVVIALLVAVITVLLYLAARHSETVTPSIRDNMSVAVIPFTDLTPRQESKHLTLGIVESLLTHLSKYEGLRVSSRADATLASRQLMSMRDQAKSLGVAYLVEGSLQTLGRQQRVTAQLIRAADGLHVTSIEVDVNTASLENLDAAIRKVAHKLRVRLREDVRRRLPSRFIEFDGVHPMAVDLYLDSEEEYNSVLLGENGSALHALDLMKRANAIDPGFEGAIFDLAWNYAHRTVADITVEEASERAHQVLAPLLARDPVSSSTLFYLSQVYILLDLDYEKAGEAIRQGLALAPRGLWWNYFLSKIALREGRANEVLPLLEKSMAKDFGEEEYSFQSNYAGALYDAGKYRSSLVASRRALELSGEGLNKARSLIQQAAAMMKLGDSEGANASVETAWSEAGNLAPGLLGFAFALVGQPDRARPLLQTKHVHKVRGFVAAGHLLLGDKDSALMLLEAGIDERDPSVLDMLRSAPVFASLRDTAEYTELLRKVASIERRASGDSNSSDSSTGFN